MPIGEDEMAQLLKPALDLELAGPDAKVRVKSSGLAAPVGKLGAQVVDLCLPTPFSRG